MKQRWSALPRAQKCLLLLQGALALLFLLLYATLGRQQVIWYRDAPLRLYTEGTQLCYTGRLHGREAAFTVSPGPVVTYRWGETQYGPYTILEAPDAVPEDSPALYGDGLTGVEVWEGDTLFFRGAYLLWDGGLSLFDADGSDTLFAFSITNDRTDTAPTARDILQVAFAPGVAARGHFSAWLLGCLVCAANALSILYADFLFRFRLAFLIHGAEDAEPSEWALFNRWIAWLAFTGLALFLFVMGLTAA